MYEAQLQRLVLALVATVRRNHPDWDGWGLAMSPDVSARLSRDDSAGAAFDPATQLPRRDQGVGGLEVLAHTLLPDLVTCSPVADADSTRSAPPDYHLDLTTGMIARGIPHRGRRQT